MAGLGRLGGAGRRGAALAMLLVVGGQVGDVLVGQRVGDAAHGRVLALALLVGVQRGGDVLGALARDHRHLVDLGKAGLVALDAVAADAHGDLCFSPALASPLTSWAWAEQRSQKRQPGQKIVANSLFILRAQSGEDSIYQSAVDYIWRATPVPADPAHSPTCPYVCHHEIPRLQELRRHPGPDAGRQRRHHAASARCWSRASPAPARPCWPRKWPQALKHAAAAVAHQVHHQGAAGPVRIRRGEPPARLAAAATSRSRTSTTTSSRACCGRPSPPTSRWRC